MDKEVLALAAFVVLFAMMAIRIPVGIAMGLVGAGGFAMVVGVEPALAILANSPITTATEYTYGLVPMFILMGVIATRSGMSQELYSAASAWMGHRRGGMAMAAVGACGGFSAICGSSVATAATMAKISIPEMRRLGYGDSMASGVVAAGGTLGILIPPSLGLALYGIITEQSITELFIAGVIPGLLAVAMYMLTVQVIAWIRPGLMPPGPRLSWSDRFRSLRGTWAVLVLFLFIVGGLYFGLFAPTEAAGMGACGALIISVARGKLPFSELVASLVDTIRLTSSIFIILIGAMPFGYFLAVTQVPQALTSLVAESGIGPYGVLTLILIAYVILGALLDELSMIILTLPLIFPLVKEMGFDPIWFGVIIVMVMELGLITPPVGMNCFVIKAVVKDIPLGTIYKGVAPFILADYVRLLLLILFPGIVLFLPRTMS